MQRVFLRVLEILNQDVKLYHITPQGSGVHTHRLPHQDRDGGRSPRGCGPLTAKHFLQAYTAHAADKRLKVLQDSLSWRVLVSPNLLHLQALAVDHVFA